MEPFIRIFERREYLDCYCSMSLDVSGPEYVEELFSCFSTETKAQLTHGDLSRNILAKGSKITEILDWEAQKIFECIQSGNLYRFVDYKVFYWKHCELLQENVTMTGIVAPDTVLSSEPYT